MKTIAEQLNVKEFPFTITNKNGNIIYQEHRDIYNSYEWVKKEFDENNNEIFFKQSDGYWIKQEYDKNSKRIYFENSDGKIIDNRPKQSKCVDKIIQIDNKKYKLIEI